MPYEYDIVECKEASTLAATLTTRSQEGWEAYDTHVSHSGAGTHFCAFLRRFAHNATDEVYTHPGIDVGSNATEAPAGLGTGDDDAENSDGADATDPAADDAAMNQTDAPAAKPGKGGAAAASTTTTTTTTTNDNTTTP